MKQKILYLLLSVLLATTILSVNANAAEQKNERNLQNVISGANSTRAGLMKNGNFIDQGYCGDNVLWGLTTDGILLIVADGKATMSDYGINYYNLAPWYEYKDFIYFAYVDGNVGNLGDCAFYQCENLVYCCIEEGVTAVGNSVFYQCSSLEEVDLPTTLKTMGYNVFGDCTKLTSVQLPSGLTKIGQSAFNQCTSLTSITLPPNITAIEYNTFCGCEKLRSINIPSKVTYIGAYAFAGCAFTSVTIPKSVTVIRELGFAYCENLKSVTFSPGLTTIERMAFYQCYSLEKVALPNTLKNLGDEAFEECIGLKEVILSESMHYISENTFTNCTSLSRVIFPSHLKAINSGAFAHCVSLTEISFPSYLETIHAAAFTGCLALTKVRIPAMVNYIDTNAFAHCKKLLEVSILNPNVGFGSTVFNEDHAMVIRCIENSTAQTYAQRNGHNFEFINLSIVTEYFDDVYTDWYTEYVQYVYDNSLMTGIKGVAKFEPNANITKAQVAQVLYNMEGQPGIEDKVVFMELKDVYDAEWYANAVAWAYHCGVVTGGLDEKKFYPNANITREQLALMMFRYADYKGYDITISGDISGLKNDWKVNSWALDGVKWAVGTGLISGIDNNGTKDLAPQGNATRAQMAAILQRFYSNVKTI